MTIKIYNTQSRKAEEFRPVREGQVTMYVCGPTVYDLMHIGNFRGAIFFNLVRNWFEKSGYKVVFAYNYTDVDDKIIRRAQERKVSAAEVSAKYIDEFRKDFAALGLRPHDHNPRVTEFMEQVVAFVKDLVEKEFAYEVEGEVIFSIDRFSNYGKLSGRNLEDLEAGHRVKADEKKRNPLDFVLWKPSKEGEPAWDSPWGSGRPGWHIECSAMSRELLGDEIDIHGGGADLVFPHHENEAAQSEAATGKPFVRYWMHNAFIQFDGDKMSKSLGNVWTARDFLAEYGGEVLKYMMLSAHYRSPITFSDHQIMQAMTALGRIYSALSAAGEVRGEGKEDTAFEAVLKEADGEIAAGLNDDFNTPVMLAQIFKAVRAYNASSVKKPHPARAARFFDWVREHGKLLSLFQENPRVYLRTLDDLLLKKKGLSRAAVDAKVSERTEARGLKDYAASDRIRGELDEMGIALRDGAGGTVWEVKKE